MPSWIGFLGGSSLCLAESPIRRGDEKGGIRFGKDTRHGVENERGASRST